LLYRLQSATFSIQIENWGLKRSRPNITVALAKPPSVTAGRFVLLSNSDLSRILSSENWTPNKYCDS